MPSLKIIISLALILQLITGCGIATRFLDQTWVDKRTVYPKPHPLPPLEIPPELGTSN